MDGEGDPRPGGGSARDREVLAARARALATPVAPAPELMLAMLALDAGAERYAVPLEAVLRVDRAGRVARVPGAPPGHAGLVLVAGRPCALVDLPAHLGASGEPVARRWAVVLGRRAPELAIAADRVSIEELPRARLAPAPRPRLGLAPDGRAVLDPAALWELAA